MGERSRACVDCGHTQKEEFYPEGTLYRSIKDEKEAVKELQTWLTDCGYLNDTIDGIFGKKTEQAVKDFQEKAGINADGIAWPQTNKLLEKEWQVLKGIYVEESVETIEVIEFVATQLPACCTRIENENGAVEIAYCADHKVLADAVNALFEPEDTEEDKLNALTLVRSMYQEELDMLYSKWMEASAQEDQANVVGAQAMFTGLLNMQETAWNKQYGENSAEKLEKINDMLHNQIIEICGILNLTAAE
ncbi:MAG: peptidoglycan-binding protein [Clostridia bacterium]|nr:peptidoglycan-binding protein [Clostridia bacterium]